MPTFKLLVIAIRRLSQLTFCVMCTVAIALAYSSIASAQAWLNVATSKNTTLYIDPASVARINMIVKVTELADFKVDQSDRGGFSYRSQVTHYEINCEKHVRRMLSQATYLGAFGMGKKMSSLKYVGSWISPTPSSIGEVLVREVCAGG
jgi:hypothetical protein